MILVRVRDSLSVIFTMILSVVALILFILIAIQMALIFNFLDWVELRRIRLRSDRNRIY